MIRGMHRTGVLPWPLLLVLGLLLVALGVQAAPILGAPVLLGFAVYLLLPYRRLPWALRTLAVLGVVAVFWLVGRFGGILLILAFSLFLAYLLDPAVDFLEKRRFSRTAAILVLLVPAAVLLGLAALVLVPPLVHQVTQLLEALSTLGSDLQRRIEPLLEDPRVRPFYERYQEEIPKVLGFVQQALLQGLSGVLDATRTLGSLIGALVLIPVVSFYFLRDYDRLRAQSLALIPIKYHGAFSAFGGETDRLLGHWLRGSGLVALIMAVLTGTGLALLGVPYALLLGALAGVLNFVPVLGFWVSTLAAALVALVSGGPLDLLKVASLYTVLSVLEGNLLQPKLVGERIGLHPVAMLLALVVFADAFGILGAFIAVPLAILVLIVARQARAVYLASDLYRDAPEGASPLSEER